MFDLDLLTIQRTLLIIIALVMLAYEMRAFRLLMIALPGMLSPICRTEWRRTRLYRLGVIAMPILSLLLIIAYAILAFWAFSQQSAAILSAP